LAECDEQIARLIGITCAFHRFFDDQLMLFCELKGVAFRLKDLHIVDYLLASLKVPTAQANRSGLGVWRKL
jgi:hypothetical protein